MTYSLIVSASGSHCQIQMDGKGLAEYVVDGLRLVQNGTHLLSYYVE